MKPHPIHALAATLIWNAVRGSKDQPTICSTTRTEVRPVTFVLGWAALTSWLVPHYCKPFFGQNKENPHP